MPESALSMGKIQPGTFQFALEDSPLVKMNEFAQHEHQTRQAEYQQHVLDYATKWEQCVTSKVDQELKTVKKLQQSRAHYEKKVEGLRRKVNALDSRGKDIPSDLLTKLERNESKLKEAWETHEWNASRLCKLIEEVVHCGWKDLLPLITNLLKVEFNRSGGALALYGKFPMVMDSLQQPFVQEQQQQHHQQQQAFDMDQQLLQPKRSNQLVDVQLLD